MTPAFSPSLWYYLLLHIYIYTSQGTARKKPQGHTGGICREKLAATGPGLVAQPCEGWVSHSGDGSEVPVGQGVREGVTSRLEPHKHELESRVGGRLHMAPE